MLQLTQNKITLTLKFGLIMDKKRDIIIFFYNPRHT
jgi:hypothetical protein